MSSGVDGKKSRWIYSTFPISLATGPLGTMVQLVLIQLNGQTLGTLYISLASATFNGVSIPASLFWGYATDRLHKRRLLVVSSYALTAVVMLFFTFYRTTFGTIGSYGVFAFVSAASSAPLSLLIMESEQKSRWATTFARLSMTSSVGNVGGYLVTTIGFQAFPVEDFFLPLGIVAMGSAVLAFITISEPSFVFERQSVALGKPGFFNRLKELPLFFLAVPRVSDFRRAFRGLRSTMTRYVPLFYISTILFYASSGLFNTSFIPAMAGSSLSRSEISAVLLAGLVVQTVTFQVGGNFVGSRPLVMTSVQGLLLRGWSYVAVGAAAIFVTGSQFLVPALIFYPLASGIAFAIYYTSSNTMMFNTVQSRNAGSALGVYSAIVGIAAAGGSLASGFISVYLGFTTTFVLAGVLLFAAVGVVSRLPRSKAPEQGPHQ